ncbi:cytochrome d ubiquinol oxidase subunit II [Humidisolicoccus flavus]|uniref:cytochrome d ubiquinol oxidase subunit II n=1 Tax=Humidisolicoccus flavus TaxID=3111414 RepID=UPI00324CC0CE
MDLATLWFFIVGVMFVIYFVLDGFDFGVGMALPFLGKTDAKRRQMINSIGPVWDLNETWVIVAGASLFAAFPEWYATMFSGFYLALLLLLLGLIVRAVSFEWRHQRPESTWKKTFDRMIIVGSILPAFLWGVAFANIAQGVALAVNPAGGFTYTGTFFDLLNPYALLGGLTTLTLFFVHGVVFIALKTDGELQRDARALAIKSGVVAIVLGASFLVWTCLMVPHPLIFALAAVAAVTLIGAWVMNVRGREGWSFALTAATIAFAVLALYMTLFVRDGGPFVMPASNPSGDMIGLTVANASSSAYTLQVMSWAALFCLPLVLAYQGWTYWVFRKRVLTSSFEKVAH